MRYRVVYSFSRFSRRLLSALDERLFTVRSSCGQAATATPLPAMSATAIITKMMLKRLIVPTCFLSTVNLTM
jgi:hypothetical protein